MSPGNTSSNRGIGWLVRWTALLGLVLLAFGIFQTGTAFASTTNWTGNGTSGGTCNTVGQFDDLSPGPGQQGWLFILTSPDAGPWTLSTNFSSGPDPSDAGEQKGNGSVHFVVYADIGATLISASATNGGNNLVVSHCEVAADPDIEITKTPSQASVAQGGTFTYEIVVSNEGTGDATNVVVTDSFSGNGTITDIAVSPTNPTCETSNTFPCNLGTIGDGDSVTITVTVQAGSQNCEPINNSASVTADGNQSDTDTTGNQVTVTGCTAGTPSLSITKTPSTATVAQGGSFTYEIVVTNTGTAAAASVVVNDTLSGNGTITDIATTVVSSNGCETSNTFPCNYATLAAAGSITITVTVQAGSQTCEPINNSAAASATSVSTVTDNTGNQVQVTGCGPALTITKTPSAASVAQGATFTYSIIVTNVGNATANSIVVADTLSGNGTITDIATSVASSDGCETSNTFDCQFASLIAGSNITITVTVTAGTETCEPIDNVAVTAATDVSRVSDSTGNQVTVTGCGPALTITKTPSTGTVAQGGSFTYSIVITNTGNDNADNLVVGDSLSGNGAITDIASTVLSSNNCEGTNTFPCNYATLADGNSITITVTVTAGTQNCNAIDNSVTVTATGDIIATDNTDNVVTVSGCAGSITIVKNVVGGTDNQDFCFTSSFADQNGGGSGDFCLDDDGNNGNALSNSITFSNLTPGDYTIEEIVPGNWEVVNIVCNADVFDVDGDSVTITLQSNETASCRFDNDEEGDNDGGGDNPPPVIITNNPPPTIVNVPPAVVQVPPTAQVAGVQQVAPQAQQPPVAEVLGVQSQLPTQLPRSGTGGLLDDGTSQSATWAGLALIGASFLLTLASLRMRSRG